MVTRMVLLPQAGSGTLQLTPVPVMMYLEQGLRQAGDHHLVQAYQLLLMLKVLQDWFREQLIITVPLRKTLREKLMAQFNPLPQHFHLLQLQQQLRASPVLPPPLTAMVTRMALLPPDGSGIPLLTRV